MSIYTENGGVVEARAFRTDEVEVEIDGRRYSISADEAEAIADLLRASAAAARVMDDDDSNESIQTW